MKKGFLNNTSSTTTTKVKSNELIEISRPKTMQTKDFRVFDEVQQAMNEEEQSKSLTLFYYILSKTKKNYCR